MTTEEMLEELTQFHEAAGFADYYERELKGKSDEEILRIYEEWRKTYVEDEQGS